MIVGLVMTDQSAGANACIDKIRKFRIEGTSLVPLIQPRQVVETVAPNCAGTIMTGDIILFRSGAHKSPIIKQVRGIRGDTFSMSGANIILNGSVLTNTLGAPYVLSKGRAQMIALYERDFGGVIPPDAYLVLGTMTGGGLDSTRLGLISHSDVIGVVSMEDEPQANTSNQ